MSGISRGDFLSFENTFEVEDAERYNTAEKWFIRQKWVNSAISRRETNGQIHIKYLTLTSVNLYDIKFLDEHRLLGKTETGYDKESLVVCESDTQRNIQIGINLPGVFVFPGTIQSFLSIHSLDIRNDTKKWFPFDVINLDLTGSAFARNQHLVKIIRKIFLIQNWHKHSFTLFLTICSESEGTDEEARSKFQSFLDDNLRNPDLKEEFYKKYPDGHIANFHEYLSFVLAKMIIEIGNSFYFRIRCQDKCTYIGRGLTNRMISLIFENEYSDETGAIVSIGQIRHQRISEVLVKECNDVSLSLSQNETLNEICKRLVVKYAPESTD